MFRRLQSVCLGLAVGFGSCQMPAAFGDEFFPEYGAVPVADEVMSPAPAEGLPPAPEFYSVAPSRWEELLQSPNLTGDWGGYRTELAENGIGYQAYLTQFYQGDAHGGDREVFQYGGKFDQFIAMQGEKLGLWQGFFVNMHAETRFGEDANFNSVGLAPVNANMLWPSTTQTTALSGITFTQALSEEWLVSGGKFNSLDLLNSIYPQIGRGIDGFMNTSILLPMAALRPLNLSVMGVSVAKMHEGQVQGTLAVVDANNSSTTVGVSDLFSQGAVILGYWRHFTEFNGLAGSHAIMGEYSTRHYTSLDPTDFAYLPGTGIVPGKQSGTWAITYIAEQKLWVDAANAKRNVGLLTNLGISDGNPSPFHWSGNISLQAQGISDNRPSDAMGVGYFYTGISGDLKNLVGPVLNLQDVQGGELYYNVAVTPWLNITPDLQIIQPGNSARETAIVTGLRGKLTF